MNGSKGSRLENTRDNIVDLITIRIKDELYPMAESSKDRSAFRQGVSIRTCGKLYNHLTTMAETKIAL